MIFCAITSKAFCATTFAAFYATRFTVSYAAPSKTISRTAKVRKLIIGAF